MSLVPAVRPVLVAAVLLGLAACGQGSPPPGSPEASTASVPGGSAGTLVLQAELTGGFLPPDASAGRLPIASVYADGRVFVVGPTAAIYPPFAWPNLQVVDVGRDRVQELADRALAAGVAETGDLGMPPLADVPTTRFTLVTATETHVREVYGLTETSGTPGSGLTDAQAAARDELKDLLDELSGLAFAPDGEPAPEPWNPTAVAAIARPWTEPGDGMTQPEEPWPGPPLPGEPIGPFPDVSCVTAIGDEATAVVEAAQDANMLTPWVTPDGSRWSVLFRPLLPHEVGCDDLTD
jgi:hypothetical protein